MSRYFTDWARSSIESLEGSTQFIKYTLVGCV